MINSRSATLDGSFYCAKLAPNSFFGGHLENMIAVGGYGELMDLLPSLHPEDHKLVINSAHTTPEQFTREVKEAQGLISDFDGTLHAGSQWIDMSGLMTPELAAIDRAEAAEYFGAVAGSRTDHDDLMFLFRAVDRLITSKVSLDGIHQKASRSSPRVGAIDLLQSFDSQMVVIVSFGIRQYIKLWWGRWSTSGNTLEVAALDVSFMSARTTSRMMTCDPLTAVTDGNKGYLADAFRASRGLEDRRTIVLGDAPTDIKMMRPENIAILVMPKIDHQADRLAHRLAGLQDLWPRVSAVLVSDSLEPLAALRK